MAQSILRQALKGAAFRRFYLARTVSQWGDTFSAVAIIILVFRLTGSGLHVGVVVIFEVLPTLLFGLLAGRVVDRFSRLRVMILADLARAVIALTLALFHSNILVIYAAAFFTSGFSVFFNPASLSLIPSIVGSDELLGANSVIWSTAVLSQIVLAPIAGILVTTAGAGPAFALNGGSFLLSAIVLARLKISVPRPPRRECGDRRLSSGWQIIRHRRLLSTLANTHLLAALSAGATSALLVVLAERHLRVGPTQFGFLLAAIGLGALLGPLLLSRSRHDVRTPLWLFGPYLVRGVVDLVLASSYSFPLALAALVFYGVATSSANAVYGTTLQTTVPDEARGRVFVVYDMIWGSARLVSIGVGGLLADAVGVTSVYFLGAALLFVAGLTGLARTSRDEVIEQVHDER